MHVHIYIYIGIYVLYCMYAYICMYILLFVMHASILLTMQLAIYIDMHAVYVYMRGCACILFMCVHECIYMHACMGVLHV